MINSRHVVVSSSEYVVDYSDHVFLNLYTSQSINVHLFIKRDSYTNKNQEKCGEIESINKQYSYLEKSFIQHT